MMPSAPVITRTEKQLKIRLPARPVRGWSWIAAILLSAVFCVPGGFIIIAFDAPQLLTDTPAAHRSDAFGSQLIGGLFGGVLVLACVVLIGRVLLTRFGHSKIVVTAGRIRNVERWGLLFQRTTRPLGSINRFKIVPPDTVFKTAGEPLMNLEASFSGSMPFTVASLYPAETLKPVAAELARAIHAFGGPKCVEFDRRPPPLPAESHTANEPVSIDLAPTSWPVAVLPLGFVLVIAFAVLLDSPGPTWQDRLGAAFQIDGFYSILNALMWVGGSCVAIGMTLTMRTRYHLEADREALRVESRSPLGRSSRTWPAAEIREITIKTTTHRFGKGGSHTTHKLMLRLNNRRHVKLVGNRPPGELQWLQKALTAGLGRPSEAPERGGRSA